MTQQTQHRKFQTLAGFFVSFLSLAVYVFTAETSVSFWDCGEFIAAADRLQVPHAPGAPFYLLIARVFTLFASSPELVSFAVTMVSAVASAATVGVVFLILTKIISIWSNHSSVIISGGLTGALSLAFSDSFWTSATEAEVYSLSNLFLVLIIWAAFKFQEGSSANRFRWILLISFLLGCASGVHLLSLLTIPAVTLIIGYRENKYLRNSLAAIIGLLITLGIEYVLIPGPMLLAEKLEVLLVNEFGLPFFTGVLLIYSALLFLFLGMSAMLRNRSNSSSAQWIHIASLTLFFFFLGASSYTVAVLRAQAGVPLNEGAPDDTYSLQTYLAREQFGQAPVFYGSQYTAPILKKDGNLVFKDGKPERGGYADEGYITVSENRMSEAVYDPKHSTFFPRLHSSRPQHVRAYKKWAAIPDSLDGRPTFAQNFRFFIRYQLGHQFFRYLFWNFVGRQNNFQGEGGPINGNWITGFEFFDSSRGMGTNTQILSNSDSRTRSVFFGIPLLLGLIGLFVNFSKDGRSAYAILSLFLITGIALVVFLNQTPFQPRERDYVYLGAFIAFSLWVGIGAAHIAEQFRKLGGAKMGLALGLIIPMICPSIMLANGYHLHQKNGRDLVREMAFNYLRTCPPNTILFTQGDNDTYPLWYLQYVEGFRTDVRVVNISLLNTDWFLEQLRKQQFDSEPIQLSIDQKHFRGDRLLYIPNVESMARSSNIPLQEFVDFVVSEHDSTRYQGAYFMKDRLPGTQVTIPFNGQILTWSIGRNYLLKADLAMLDIIANNLENRPIAFAASCGSSSRLGLTRYLNRNGLVYLLDASKAENISNGVVVKKPSENAFILQREFDFSATFDPTRIHDEEAMRISWMYRDEILQTARSLYETGDKKEATALLDHSLLNISPNIYFLNHVGAEMAALYLKIGENEKGMTLLTSILNDQLDRLEVITKMKPRIQKTVGHSLESTLSEVEFLFLTAKGKGLMTELKREEIRFKQLSKVFLEG